LEKSPFQQTDGEWPRPGSGARPGGCAKLISALLGDRAAIIEIHIG